MKRTFALLLLLQLLQSGNKTPLELAARPRQSTRSAAVADRGLKPSDFPQLKKLKENIYVFSDLHTLGYMTNDLIVITTDGVLVADGQGTAGVTQKMVDQIKTLTAQPIKYVVICSEHGSSSLPAQDAPSDQSSTCSLCLLCWKFGAGGLAPLPQAAIDAIVGPQQTFDLSGDPDRTVFRYSPHPPSRGPPALA